MTTIPHAVHGFGHLSSPDAQKQYKVRANIALLNPFSSCSEYYFSCRGLQASCVPMDPHGSIYRIASIYGHLYNKRVRFVEPCPFSELCLPLT